jgi:hypothetical protein
MSRLDLEASKRRDATRQSTVNPYIFRLFFRNAAAEYCQWAFFGRV